MKRTTTTDFNPIRGRRRTIKKPTKMKIKTRQPGRSEARWSSKKKRRPRRDLQSISIAEAVSGNQNIGLPKHINCRGCTKWTKEKNHRNFATTRKSTRSQQKYQVERILMQKISALHRPRSRKHLYKKIQMRTKSMRIPTFHHTSPTKRAVRIKSILIAAETRCTEQDTKPHKWRRMDGHKARKLFDHNQRGEFGDNCTIMMPRDRIDKIPTPVAAERHMCHG